MALVMADTACIRVSVYRQSTSFVYDYDDDDVIMMVIGMLVMIPQIVLRYVSLLLENATVVKVLVPPAL